ncbi:MAG: single-stranded DNA-binding protein [Planctomycetes bacterium]|nr:single-stranded DNA-binding protein [Planctomycetota bacterium]
MANFNKVILIGRLTRDPECRTFSNGGKVAKFGFAVSNRKKNTQSGQWEDEPMFIDVEAFNRGETGTLANTIEQYCRKGSMICIEGKLHLDNWDDKTTGQKRSKHKIIADTIQLIDTKQRDGASGGESRPASRPAAAAASGNGYSPSPEEMDEPSASSGGGNEEIPF